MGTLLKNKKHVHGELGAKPFVDDVLLGQGFLYSRAAPWLRSIENQPSTEGFVKEERKRGGGGGGGGGVLGNWGGVG